MTSTLSWWIRRTAATVTAATLVAAALAGCSTGAGTAETVTAAAPSARSVAHSSAPGVAVVLRFGGRAVPVTLSDNPTSRRFAATLPLTVDLGDSWGQAKTGRLAHPLPVRGAARTLRPVPGGIYYWPATATLALYYDDLGQRVPAPGLVRLGVVDGATGEMADAGAAVTVRIDRATGS